MTDARSGQSFDCHAGETLLNAVIRSGNAIVRVGCRAGGCGVCKVRITGGSYTTGKMSRAQVSEDEESRGYVLACRTMPTSNIEMLGQGAASGNETESAGVRT